MFAMVVPGLGRLVGDALAGVPGATVHGRGSDGRSDVILFDATRDAWDAIAELGLTEDVFVEVGRTLREEGERPHWIAGRIWRPERAQRALSAWKQWARATSNPHGLTFRVIARVLQDRSFLRTELRRSLTEAIQRGRPGWRHADPSQLEVWISEYRPGRLVAGLRLSSARMRQHGGRAAEREGALRPTVARAMVNLAGDPAGRLIDPCCGSGTILSEAVAAGWDATGFDIDPAAVRVARANVAGVIIEVGDARHLAVGDADAAACVSNLPFGQRYEMQGEADTWLRDVLGQMSRATRPGGRIVVMIPALPRRAVPATLRLQLRYPVTLLGLRTTIWAFDRLP